MFGKRSSSRAQKKPRRVKNRVPTQDNNALIGGSRKITKRKKKQIIICIILIVAAVIYGVTMYKQHVQNQKIIEKQQQFGKLTEEKAEKMKTDKDGNPVKEKHTLSVRIINVGEGESVFVSSGEKSVLIDGGPGGNAEKSVKKAVSRTGGILDYVINTSPTAYRTAGLTDVYNDVTVRHTLYLSDKAESEKDASALKSFLAAAKESGSTVEKIKDATIDLGNDVTLRLIPLYSDSANSESVLGCYIKYNDFGVLMTSDAEGRMEKKLLNVFGGTNSYPVSAWIIGNLGKGEVAQQDVIRHFSPQYFFLSCSSPRVNGGVSPDKTLVSRFDDGGNLYATYQYGDIVMTYDGENLSCSVEGKNALSSKNFAAKPKRRKK